MTDVFPLVETIYITMTKDTSQRVSKPYYFFREKEKPSSDDMPQTI